MNALPRESNTVSCQPDINLSIAALASQQDLIHARPDKLNGRFRKERDQLYLSEILNNRNNPDDVFLKAMCSEYNRLVTYSDFPNCDSEIIEDMAESGFFYTGQKDRVQCVFCRGVLKNWRPRDIPRDEHRKHFPLCPFVCGDDTENEAVLFFEVCGPPFFLGFFSRHDSRPNNLSVMLPLCFIMFLFFNHSCSREQLQCAPDVENFDILYSFDSYFRRGIIGSWLCKFMVEMSFAYIGQQEGALVYYELTRRSKQTKRNESPEYSSESERHRSFLNWPRNHHQAVADMVQAGFFYLGHGDKVKCFRCGGVLGDWEAQDMPWKEHARWYPHCSWAKRLTVIHTL